MGLSPAGRALVIVFVIIGVALLVQLVYVLWYRRRFRRNSAGDSELASIISDRSGTPASKEVALYYLYYRNQPPTQLEPPAAVPNSNNAEEAAAAASTSQTRARAATAATQEAPTLSTRPPIPEAAAAASTTEEEEEEEEKYGPGNPEDMMCPSFSGMVRDFTKEDGASSASASAGGSRTASTRKDSGLRDPTPFGTPTTSPPFISPVASPVRDVVEFRRYANKVARRVAMPS